MRRDPVLHIKQSDLITILNEIEYSSRTIGLKLSEKIFTAAQPYQITDRYLDILNLKSVAKKKVSRSMEADNVPNGLIEKVNLMLIDIRQKLNSRAKVRGITKKSNQYLMLKEITKKAYDFSVHFDIVPKTDGVREFLELGIGFMGKYGLNRFKTYEERIYEAFEGKLAVLTDPNKEQTRDFYAIWQEVMLEYSGIQEITDIDKDLTKYANMVYARAEADEYDADYRDWITGQFEGLAFLNVIPEVYQMFGEGARNRYSKYKKDQLSNKSNTDSDDDVLNIYK